MGGPMLQLRVTAQFYLESKGKAMGNHSSTLAWKITWTEEPGKLQSMGSQRVRHYWVTSVSLSTFMHWRRKWQLTPVFFPGESQGGVTQSQTRLKWLSSSSSSALIKACVPLISTSDHAVIYGEIHIHDISSLNWSKLNSGRRLMQTGMDPVGKLSVCTPFHIHKGFIIPTWVLA